VNDRTDIAGRILILVAVVFSAAVAGWIAFVGFPGDLAELLGVLLVGVTVAASVRVGSSIAESVFPSYNVAEVAVEGPITRDGGGGPSLPAPRTPSADEIVGQIERADEDDAVDALLVKLNTPGGEVVPSDDIRLAAEHFDGPTVAYATDVCASGGYWIASGCDALWAREGSLVGSIGVIGSRINATDLAEKVGISYERLAAGEYKDAGTPLREMEPDEREYLQGLIDDYYEHFVERVTEGREIDAETVRDTEARVYLGGDAADVGLVDELGTREDVEEQLGRELKEAVSVREFEPQRGFAERVRGGAAAVAFAVGAGAVSVVDDEREFDLRLRV